MASSNQELLAATAALADAAKGFNGDHAEHLRLLKLVDKVKVLIETPMDVLMKQWEMSQCIAALYMIVQLGVLEAIPKSGTISSKELSSIVEVDESAITRGLRLIVVNGICVEPTPKNFALNANAFIFLKGRAVEFFKFCVDQMGPFFKLPEYFRSHKQDDLYDLKKSPYAWAVGMEGSTYYEALSSDAEKLNNFNFTMATSEAVTPILGMFPFSSMKEQVEADPSRAFAVDIGGGRGQFLHAIEKEEAPNGFGAKLILQDRPEVLDTVPQEELGAIEKMAYDFFTPQVVKNAHLYILRRVLHDFYSPVCIEILKNTASAMGPTSRLIIFDMVMPDRAEFGNEVTPFWMDFNLMMLNGTEKTEEEFVKILDAAGLEIVKIWPFSFGNHANLECRLKST